MNAAWRERLRARIDAAPTAPRVPLALAIGTTQPQVIGSIESGLALELSGAGLALRDAGEAWQIEVGSAAAVDPQFAAIAAQLRLTGRASAWRDELLDVRTPADVAEGRRVGVIERAAVRPLGIASRAVHLVACDAAGGVWVQQRALDKAVDPGRWDTTMGGLVAAHESIDDTLARETWEEAGLRLDQMRRIEAFGRFTVRRPLAEGYMVEHVEAFTAELQAGVTPSNRDGEVARFECLDRAAVVARLEADAFTLEAATILVQWLERRAEGPP